MSLKTSIALATFNGETYISEQIRSLLAQTMLPDEFIISDDGSSDDTILVVKTVLKESRIHLILTHNLFPFGYAQNFNKALELTSGQVVFLSDQDDVWLEEKLSKVKQAFAQNPDKYLIIHDLAYCNEALKPIGQTKLERLKSIGASHRSYVTGMATAIRREFLDVCLPIPNNPLITHDLWLHECAHALGIKKVIPDVLAWYRRHGLNVTNDSVINSAEKTNLFSFIKKQNIKKMKSHVERRVVLLEELVGWSQSDDVRRFCMTQIGIEENALEMIRNNIEIELTFAKKRRALLDKASYQRALCAIILYFQGGYKQFLGKKSLFKDIFLGK